ncbi:CRISPR-associated endoribonuclease Cas2 [Fusobacterium sp. DD29]|nr:MULTISPECIES: CRISPR-associated endonuclease Cas2 [unclassified Fusobacterium]MBR8750272.1 CRISPR-associated endoribonuclease Cas2 [Fusobacterium sp. DD29]MBR8750852.1 CRISPR-associated endoribonuclease Cas2 [Fusobacterium sp. DD26]MBR8768533.1 CRISPR-associated endoribonuclease Cas2 [Fusobacterium sp. DD43]MBR8772590.1 CRISPR-associated endoribonuclease Cas2 [Fusobacterium sp. DD40]MBR8776837.1 CRISPR-associated endoribonuclease Cas2 [Fusobacterium sp. DD17]MBR8805580.1 CRISPR-associated 
MRLIIMFDLPMENNTEKREYREFRNFLIKNGFLMLQYSIYVRLCTNQTMADNYIKKIEGSLPSDGAIRGLIITEKQYKKMKIFLGQKSKNESIITDKKMIIF